jgi:cytochrome c2
MRERGTVRGFMVATGFAVAVACTVAAVFAGDVAPLPEGEGKSILTKACVTCHDLSVVTEKRRNKQDWADSVNAMIGRGASLSKEQASSLVNYLAQNFGATDRGGDLVVEICSTCHELERIREQHWTKDEWREETKGMLSEGAAVSDEEVDLILNYLAKNFGRRAEQ